MLTPKYVAGLLRLFGGAVGLVMNAYQIVIFGVPNGVWIAAAWLIFSASLLFVLLGLDKRIDKRLSLAENKHSKLVAHLYPPDSIRPPYID